MVRRDVERLEVERVGLDLGAIDDDEAELTQDPGDLRLGLLDGMEPTRPRQPTRQGGVLGRRRRLAKPPLPCNAAPRPLKVAPEEHPSGAVASRVARLALAAAAA